MLTTYVVGLVGFALAIETWILLDGLARVRAERTSRELARVTARVAAGRA